MVQRKNKIPDPVIENELQHIVSQLRSKDDDFPNATVGTLDSSIDKVFQTNDLKIIKSDSVYLVAKIEGKLYKIVMSEI